MNEEQNILILSMIVEALDIVSWFIVVSILCNGVKFDASFILFNRKECEKCVIRGKLRLQSIKTNELCFSSKQLTYYFYIYIVRNISAEHQSPVTNKMNCHKEMKKKLHFSLKLLYKWQCTLLEYEYKNQYL